MPGEAPPRGSRRRVLRISGTAGRLNALSAEELVGLCLEGGDGAWDEFIGRYANLIYSTIIKANIQEADQEDAFQATILAVYKDLPKLRDRSKLPSWIIGIAYRQAVNRVRSRIRSRETPMEESTDSLIRGGAGLFDPTDPPDQERIHLERGQQLEEALGHLPERCKRLVQILFFEDPPLDYQEVARREQIPIGSIGPTRARCLDRIRQLYEERGWDG